MPPGDHQIPSSRLVSPSPPNSLPPVIPTLDSAVFRTVIGTVASGVLVLTTRDNAVDYGMTISAVSSLSLDPPMLLVCLNMNSSTQKAVQQAGRFAVHVLDEQQGWLAERFARSSGVNKFDGLTIRDGTSSVPILDDALAVVECEVRESVTGGTHRVFLADVVHAEAREGSPLAYFRGKFGKLELAEDAKVFETVRRQILDGIFEPAERLEVENLAASLGAGNSSIHYALTRLIGEGLVARSADTGYVVTPFDASRSNDAFDARLVIELGIAELTVGRLSQEQLDRFRTLAMATIPQMKEGRLVNVNSFIEASIQFHAFLAALPGNPAVEQAYERLSINDLMSRALSADTVVNPQLATDHLALVEAYENEDVATVREIILAHSSRSKENQSAEIAARSTRSPSR